jgi:hypothetical protein
MLFFPLFLVAGVASSFRWHMGEHMEPDQTITFTERHMFASNDGPVMMEQGEAFIEITATAYFRFALWPDILA